MEFLRSRKSDMRLCPICGIGHLVLNVHVSGKDIYTAPQGLFASVSPRSRLQRFGLRQYTPRVSWASRGPAGLIAGEETHFPNRNWAGFPTSYLLAGCAYPAGNWFIAGLVLGAVRRTLGAEGVARWPAARGWTPESGRIEQFI